METTMNKQRAAKLYELADRLSKLDVNSLSEQQRQQRSTMIAKLQEEVRTIKEFSPSDEDGGENEDLYNYAKMWYNGDMSTQEDVEKALDLIGWEIGEVETEEGGAFIIKSGDENGDTYMSFTPEDLSEGVAEDFNGEYDDEAGMAQSNLRTMARAVNGLIKTIEDNDNLPEWAQEKLAKAEMMTTSVWDYLLSQKEQGMDPKVTEARADPTGSWVVYDGSKVTKFKTHEGAKAYAEKNGGTVASSEYYHDKIAKKDVTEGEQRVDSLVTDALKIMRGSSMNDAVQALKTVLGEREYNDRRNHYNFYVRQIMDMSSQQGVTETKKPSPKLTPVEMKKTEAVSEEINKEAYERLQKVFDFSNYKG